MTDFHKKLAALLDDGFQISDLESAARIAIGEAAEQIPGSSITEQIDFARDAIIEAVAGAEKTIGHLIPGLAQWLELPAEDGLVRWGTEQLVNRWLRPVLSWARESAALG